MRKSTAGITRGDPYPSKRIITTLLMCDQIDVEALSNGKREYILKTEN